ncbi:MAG: hypothetical protein C4554_04420 [Dethiobacter sp.]|jgi:hypothetical protein|nr:MAG: hypothetical protein C4554_04420 [Dethiobacter sp.]
MRQFEWDKSVEELCSSPEEIQELKNVAFLLWDMPRPQSSSSFQAELKGRLMEKALLEENYVCKENKIFQFINKGHKYSRKILLARPLFTAAAAVLLIVSLAVFHNQGQVKPFSPEIASPENPSGIEVAQNDPAVEKEPFVSPVDKGPVEKPSGEGAGNLTGTVPERTPTSGPGDQPGATADPGKPAVTEEPLKVAPEFEAWKNQQSFKLAGEIKLPPVYYRVEKDTAVTVENVSNSWKPRKIVAVSVASEAQITGTKAWAGEILSNEGFIVREGDYLEVNLQETQKGLFVEVFYRPQKSTDNDPTLVLHYQEGTGILSYYYEEEGKAAQPGYYPLLPPAEAFKQVNNLKWYALSQRLDFSFQEVVLTYYDFLLEEDGREKTVKLPAYCFLGMETLHNGGELKLYLPAVK